jgi:hypothetical protein
VNARARIAAAFFGHSAARGAEQDRALAPSASPRAEGSGAPATGPKAGSTRPRVLLDFPARALTGAPA